MKVESLNNLSIVELIKFTQNLSFEEAKALISDELVNLSNERLNCFFMNLNIETLILFLNNEKLYSKIINLPTKTPNRIILDILLENKFEVFKLVVEHDYAVKYSEYFINYLNSRKSEKFNNLIKNIDLSKLENNEFSNMDKQQLYESLNNKLEFKLTNDIFELFYFKVKNNTLNLRDTFKIKNINEFIIYTKFGLIVDIIYDENNIVLNNGFVIPKDVILKCKDSHINKLIELLRLKENDIDSILLEAALKLYYTFGFDNSKKIIEDKFSRVNKSTLIRVNDFEFKNIRRKYRVKNPHKFYHYRMIDKIISSGDDSELFETLLYNPNVSDIQKLKTEFKEIIDNNDLDTARVKIKQKLDVTIIERETKFKLDNLKKLKEREMPLVNITAKYICELLNGVDLGKVALYNKVTKEKLNEFLLGNTKENNDCLFRIIVNKLALGLNDSISLLINDYEYIEQMANNSNLSIYSVLDLISILKVNLYDLRPNERDINLSTITRLINSVEHRIKNEVNVIKETCKLHIARKKKIYSTIPMVSGQTDFYKFEVVAYDSENLLAAGLDGKNCFRIGGLGEDFFRYCLTSTNAVVINLIDNNGNKHICPVVRSGNGINCNGIDPEVSDDLKYEAINALSQCFVQIMNQTQNTDEKIEIATISDLHMKEFFGKYLFPKYNLEHQVPIDTYCYTDYNKKDTNHYILAKAKTYNENKYYLSSLKYYQKRDNNYEYDMELEDDLEWIEILINSICYTAIDYLDVPVKEQYELQRTYKDINIKDLKYVVGNKDWFIAITKDNKIIKEILPYDERARKEFIEHYNKVSSLIEMSDSFGRKNI